MFSNPNSSTVHKTVQQNLQKHPNKNLGHNLWFGCLFYLPVGKFFLLAINLGLITIKLNIIGIFSLI